MTELPDVPTELRDLANDVRRLGTAYSADPETLFARRQAVEQKLMDLARRVEQAGKVA